MNGEIHLTISNHCKERHTKNSVLVSSGSAVVLTAPTKSCTFCVFENGVVMRTGVMTIDLSVQFS